MKVTPRVVNHVMTAFSQYWGPHQKNISFHVRAQVFENIHNKITITPQIAVENAAMFTAYEFLKKL